MLPRGGPCPARGVFRLELPSQAPWSFADEQRSEVPRLPGFLAAAGVAVTAAKGAQLCWAHARRPEAGAPRASCCPPAMRVHRGVAASVPGDRPSRGADAAAGHAGRAP